MKHLIAIIMSCIPACSMGWAQTGHEEQTREAFEAFAKAMPYLDTDAVLYDKNDQFLFELADPALEKRHFQMLERVTERRFSNAALLKLLEHPEPKVRTLAMAALFDREDPGLLPHLYKLCGDSAPTFDAYGKLAAEQPGGAGPGNRQQTVGGIATRMMELYLEPAGFHNGVRRPNRPGFVEYWAERRLRPHCASWFEVQMRRARHGISPPLASSRERIRAVRKRIDQLPPLDRAWTLLWLKRDSGGYLLAKDRERLEACRAIGPDKLMAMLLGRIPSGDPDLRLRPRETYPYRIMVEFVLQHANELLRPQDSETLRRHGIRQKRHRQHQVKAPIITPWWHIGAARLKPAHARRILRRAMAEFNLERDGKHRATLAIAFWRLLGSSELGYPRSEDASRPRGA
ncbi:MAG: hypothetical protein AAF492_00375, partial [Verrucomicrobiota bacterium]